MTSYSIPSVTTDRVTLRAPKPDDISQVVAFYQTERSHILGGPLSERDATRAALSIFGSWALRKHGLWYIADKSTDQFLGWTGIIDGPGWEEPELGWTVMQNAEGQGIAFEAAQAARHYAATELGHNGVISYIAPHNNRSRALATKLGAAHERDGTLLGHDVQIWRHPKIGAAE